MKSIRSLAAALGVAAVALGAATLAGPAAAAPSGTPIPSGSPVPSSSPSDRPSSPPASPSTSDSPTTGAEPAAPKATVYDMSVSSDSVVTFVSNGPAKGVTASFTIQVRNSGSAAQQGLTVTVVEPSDARLTGWRTDDGSIDNCVRGTLPDGRGEYTCQVHDQGPGRTELAFFDLTADVPLPANPAHPDGSVTLNGFHVPNAHPADTSVTFAVRAVDDSIPAKEVDLRVSAKPVAMARGTDGVYHGTLWPTVTNNGPEAVPPVTLEVYVPAGVTLVGPTEGCTRIGTAYRQLQTGLRCPVPALAPGQSDTLKFWLTADKPATHRAVGQLWAYVVNDSTRYTDPQQKNVFFYEVTFPAISPTPSTSGQAAGTGSPLPVTGTPLLLIAGAGTAVLAAGAVLLVLSRRRAGAHGDRPETRRAQLRT